MISLFLDQALIGSLTLRCTLPVPRIKSIHNIHALHHLPDGREPLPIQKVISLRTSIDKNLRGPSIGPRRSEHNGPARIGHFDWVVSYSGVTIGGLDGGVTVDTELCDEAGYDAEDTAFVPEGFGCQFLETLHANGSPIGSSLHHELPRFSLDPVEIRDLELDRAASAVLGRCGVRRGKNGRSDDCGSNNHVSTRYRIEVRIVGFGILDYIPREWFCFCGGRGCGESAASLAL